MIFLRVLHVLAFSFLLATVNSQGTANCDAQADILLIMDSTGSIGPVDYDKMLKFVANLTNSFTLGPKSIQFGAILFGDDAQNLFNFGAHNDHASLENAIRTAPYLAQTTYTNLALRYARLQSYTSLHGARPGITRIAIVLTDGGSYDPNETAKEAKLLKDNGVLVLSIGIGTNINQTELRLIASSPADVFQVNNFDILNTIIKQVANVTCEEAVAPPKQDTTCSVSAKADILFILDSSGSILTDNYKKMLNFVVDLTRNFKFGPNEIQFASIIFGDDAEEVFDFKNYTSRSSLEAGILAIPYLMGWTYTDRALLMAKQMFTPTKGSRSNVPKIAIVFTDGQSNDPSGTQQQAKLLKDSGVLVLSIGIGPSVNQQELESIASKAEDVFQVTNFDVLSTIGKEVTNITCREVTSDEIKPACDAVADILLIMDSSGSIKIDNYNKMLNFVVNLTKNFKISPNAIQFANVIFSDNAKEVFDFSQFTNQTALEAAILKTPYLQGGTYTNEALELARLQMFKDAKGSRPGVPKIAIVFTDGQSTDRRTTAEQARLLKNMGVRVLSIGIGSGVNNQELVTIASLPEDVFQVTNFDVLSTIQKQVTNTTCEKITAPPPACDAQADILFVMDSSGSILAGNYNKMLNFVVNLTRSFNVGPNAVQFGNVIFSDNAREIFDFRKYSDHTDLEKGILGTPYLLGATYTNKALQLAREQMFTAAKGSRPDVPKIVIVLTDGQSTNGLETANQARLLKNSGVLVLSIGIGNGVNKQELQTIASLPQDVFQVTNFDVLDTIQKQVTNKTCERVGEEKPECPAVADILFILDSTGSIGESNYKTLLKFIANFTRSFGIGTNWVQFSALSFADTAHTDFRFNTYNTHTDLEKGILNSTYFGQTTQTDLALKLAREQSFTAANGARPNVDKIVIVFTDGRSNDPGLTAAQAKLLKDSGVLVLTVAIGVDILNRELEAIATLPEDVFHVENFDTLESIEKEFASQACERVTQTIQCAAHADILFILDSSGSIGTVNYPKMLNFVANLTKNFDLGPNAVQFSTIVFGDDAHLEFDFGKYNNHPSLEQAILGIRYLAQNTFTNKALLLARLQAFTAASGARNSATKIAIVLTDGQSSLPTETTREANLLKDAGVLVLSIGIGDVVKESELEAIASLPQDVFRVNSFDVLNTIQKAVTNKTCDKVAGGKQTGCSKLADIIFLVDSSGSESDQSYKQQLLFAANFTANYHIGVDAARFGAVIFSDKAMKLFDLDDYGTHWNILQSLMAAPHLLGGTNTAGALDMIYNQGLFGVPAGGRDNATKMLIIMTDGQSANITQSVAAAQHLKNAGIQILTIGVGDIVNVAELQSLASGPGDYFQAASYEVLHQLQEEVTNHTCGYVAHTDTAIHHACSEMADIIFVMDSSDSITPEDYEKQLLFASNLTQEFDVGPVDARFASVVFSNDVFKVFDLGDFSDHLGIYNGLLKSPHLTGTTDVGKALNWVNDMNMFGSANGGRNNASKIIVLFVDNPSVDQAASIHAADRLKRDGVQITTVGVNDYNLYELRQIASSPSSAFKATSVDSLSWIERSIVDNICDFASTRSTSP